MKKFTLLLTLLSLLIANTAFAQYNRAAGRSAPVVEREMQVFDAQTGETSTKVVRVAPDRDRFGNAAGTDFDLAVDGAFEGNTVAVIQLYDFSFEDARAALKQKGFSVYRWRHAPPSPEELEKKLKKASQLWIISGDRRLLNEKHLAVIKKFFDSGKGLYIWGDNTPYHADADYVASALFDSSMAGTYWGDQVVAMKTEGQKAGVLPNHLLSTGLENIFEGITIAEINVVGGLTPFIWSSDGNVVTAIYDRGGKRAILDGGFTRLYNKWDTAGTGRYVKNAAAWLVNVERFGDDVVAIKSTGDDAKKPADQ